MTLDDFQVGQRTQGAEVEQLAIGLVGIIWTGRDQCSEILDLNDLVLGQEKLAKCQNIQPLIGRALDRAIIQVETVYINDRFHFPPLVKKQRRSKTASRPIPEGTGGICLFYSTDLIFCQTNPSACRNYNIRCALYQSSQRSKQFLHYALLEKNGFPGLLNNCHDLTNLKLT